MIVDIQTRDRKLAVGHRLAARGLVNPYLTVWAAREESLALSIACAMLEKESGGMVKGKLRIGQNVYGHDRDNLGCIPPCGGNVTKASYLAYRERRRRDGRMQGAGPTQLTWHSIQDRADALGGCWIPAVNLRVGFELLAGYLEGSTSQGAIVKAGERYNGARAYGVDLAERAASWRKLFDADRKAGRV